MLIFRMLLSCCCRNPCWKRRRHNSINKVLPINSFISAHRNDLRLSCDFHIMFGEQHAELLNDRQDCLVCPCFNQSEDLHESQILLPAQTVSPTKHVPKNQVLVCYSRFRMYNFQRLITEVRAGCGNFLVRQRKERRSS